MIARAAVICIALAFSALAHAQHSLPVQPYAGQQIREIKALSAQDIQQYLAGAGFGYAKAAELNQYPGPMHVLELADPLQLTREQRDRVAALMQAHKAQARDLGRALVDAEQSLDALFKSGSVTEPELAKRVRLVANAQGEYRLSHLDTHRQTRALLNSEQVARYDALRGYGEPAAGNTSHTGNH